MCGIFGIFGNTDASVNTALGLHALQHRGQEGGGIASWDNGLHSCHDTGRIGEIFGEESILAQLPGTMAVGHVRFLLLAVLVKQVYNHLKQILILVSLH